MSFDISVVINGHREGSLAVASIRSLEVAAREAETAGLRIERLYVLDRPDVRTQEVFEQMCPPPWRVLTVDHGDQGAARNCAAEIATGCFIAFLDGDDLWGKSWLVRAHAEATKLNPDVIIHPEFAYIFGDETIIFPHVDQEDAAFDPDLLRVFNYWDALCFCRTEILRRFPYPLRDIAEGWAFEDWQWNCETLAAGLQHKTAPDTVIFKRRRQFSQTIEAGMRKALTRRTEISRYGSPVYGSSSGGSDGS